MPYKDKAVKKVYQDAYQKRYYAKNRLRTKPIAGMRPA